MLSIAPMSSGQEDYYTSLAQEDYYLEGNEPPGEWAGSGARCLGLEGNVARCELAALFRGFHPEDGHALVRNAGKAGRRAGFDLTFSAPKSVSIVWALGGHELRGAIGRIHRHAVLRALDYLECEAAHSRRGAQGVERVEASLVAALFEHSTARPAHDRVPDPHLHTHALVLNVGVAADGRTATLDGRDLFRHKMVAGALYRAELFKCLTLELGLSAAKKGVAAELCGVPDALIREFSTRRRTIEAFLLDRREVGAERAARAALVTRSTKVRHARAELESEWRLVARAHDFEVERAVLTEANRVLSRPRAEELIDAAREEVEVLTETKSYFAARDLVRSLALRFEARMVGEELVRQVARELLAHSPNIVKLAPHEGEALFTTAAVIALERELVARAQRLHRSLGPAPSEATRGAVLAARPSMRPEQVLAAEHLLGPRRLALVSGMAGTGKTYLLAAVREAFEREGFEVRGAALAAAAAQRLEEGAGIPSQSLHRTLALLDHRVETLTRKTVLVLDEAGMVGTKLMGRILGHAERGGARLILVGDERQLQPVEAGGPFARLLEDLGSARLVDITRQRDAWARDAVQCVARGEGRRALEAFAARGALSLFDEREKLLTSLSAEWAELTSNQALGDVLVLTGTRRDARDVNVLLQHERFARGELFGAPLRVGDVEVFVGDRVLLRRNSALVTNGDRGTVTRTDEARGHLTLNLDRGVRVTLDVGAYPHVELGYASTTHVAQGATVRHCLVLVGGSTQDREATYVQASRATHSTKLYADKCAVGPGLEGLVREIERSRRKDLALDHAPGLSPQLELVS